MMENSRKVMVKSIGNPGGQLQNRWVQFFLEKSIFPVCSRRYGLEQTEFDMSPIYGEKNRLLRTGLSRGCQKIIRGV